MGAELSLVWFGVHPSPTSPLHTSCKCPVTGPLSAALPPRRKWAAVLQKKIMILPVSLMPDVMKVGGLLRQKVLVTVRGVLPMCACERQTKAETDRGRDRQRQPAWRREERKRDSGIRAGQGCALHLPCSRLPTQGWMTLQCC